MCYSALVEASFAEFRRRVDAKIDLDQFIELYTTRMQDKSIRIPRAVDRNFENPKTPAERKIKNLIDDYRKAQVTDLEQEIFTQKKRLADAERRLAVKETKD